MKRRPLCLWGAATALGVLPGALAQGKKAARICIMNTAPRDDPSVKAMFARLSDLGWSEGWFGSGNLKIEYTQVDPATADVAPLVDAVLRSPCDVIATSTTPLTLAVKSAAPSTPLVFLVGGDPVVAGLVASMARPGGNATGWTLASHETGTRLLALLKEIVPRAKRFSMIFTAGNVGAQQAYEALVSYANAAGTTLTACPVREKQDIHALDAAWRREPVDGLIVPFEALTYVHRGDIVRLAALNRLPAAYGSRYFVDAGGLLSYGVDWPVELKRTANFIARILDGAKPADIPVEAVQEFELLVNLRTAGSLGISVPPSVLAQATEVIQ